MQSAIWSILKKICYEEMVQRLNTYLEILCEVTRDCRASACSVCRGRPSRARPSMHNSAAKVTFGYPDEGSRGATQGM
jgi:hypothetical protein